jgi:Type IV secretion-system coupling protein DNA-binding domain
MANFSALGVAHGGNENGGMERFSTAPITYFARTNARNDRRVFGIKQRDRLSHMYIIGKTGTGKSTLLERLMLSDIEAGRGLALVDPHGDLAERIAARIPEHRKEDLIYLNVPDRSQPFGYNPLKRVVPERRPLAGSGLLEVFEKMWPEAWGVRMEHILRNALLALLDQPQATLPDVLRLLSDKRFRKEAIQHIENRQVRAFWENEYEKYSDRMRADGIAPIQNKVGAFLADPTLYRILTKPERPINIRRIMDEGKILLVNLAKGQIGEDASSLLGGLLVTTIGLAAFSRQDTDLAARRPFYCYLDEFQNFTTLSVANMLSELRKYRVGMIVVHQYLEQLDAAVRHAVLGNVGTLISFRLGPKDASVIGLEFQEKFTPIDLMNLPNYHIYLRLMIDGTPSVPFSAETLAPDD